MSDTTTAEKTPPPAEQEPAPERPDRGGLLAYLIGHQSGVVILVALVISLLIGAALIRYQGVNPRSPTRPCCARRSGPRRA